MRDNNNRKRNELVNFRISSEEREELENRIKLSGREKQDYFLKSTLYQTIVVIGNKVQFERLNDEILAIKHELERIQNASEVSEKLLYPIRTALEIINGFDNKYNMDN